MSALPTFFWEPDEDTIDRSNISALCKLASVETYDDLYRWSISDRGIFWETMVNRLGIRFRSPYREALNLDAGIEAPSWFAGGTLNIVESCLMGDENRLAIRCRGENLMDETVSMGDLKRRVASLSNGLRERGFRSGDCAAIMLPMHADAVVAFLAVIAAGGVCVTIADSFAAEQIRVRMEIAKPVIVFTQDSFQRAGRNINLYSRVLEAGAPACCVISREADTANNLRAEDCEWSEIFSRDETLSCEIATPDQITTILFSSGTTGAPKAIPWDQMTPVKAAIDGHLHHDIHPGDVVCWPTNLGWMMGPWLVYGSLLNGASMALFEGSPATSEFGRFVEEAGVTMFGLVPSLVSAWRGSGCMEQSNWSGIRCFSSTGECSNVDAMTWLMKKADNRPIIEYCGGTEIGGGYITGTVVQRAYPSTFSTAALGSEFVITDEEGHKSDMGEVFLVPPSLGLSNSLLNADHHAHYFAGTPLSGDGRLLRKHGDQIETLANGYYRARGRVDDAMNLSGIKVSSAQIEEAVIRADGISEAAAVAIAPKAGGPSLLVLYVVPDQGAEVNRRDVQSRMQDLIKRHLNPMFRIHDVVIMTELPRTASNKVMHRMLRAKYEAE